ncbi:MAG: YdjY domain-containing protein [Phycisphaerae bacterium]
MTQVLAGWIVAIAVAAAAEAQFPPPERPASQPASKRAKKPGEFQPGVTIDWNASTVRVAGRVVLQSGPLEFLACFPGKEHESLVLLDASATHVFMALGLIGLEHGKPPTWDEAAQKLTPASGQPIDLIWEWRNGEATRTAPALHWVRDADFDQRAISRPLLFSGSRVRGDGRVSAEVSGSGVALVDVPDALISMARSHTDRNAELWAMADERVVPPPGTPVALLIRAAQPMRFDVRLDPLGLLRIDDSVVTAADLIELIDLARRVDAKFVADIRIEARMLADRRRFERALRESALPAESWRLLATASQPTTHTNDVGTTQPTSANNKP